MWKFKEILQKEQVGSSYKVWFLLTDDDTGEKNTSFLYFNGIPTEQAVKEGIEMGILGLIIEKANKELAVQGDINKKLVDAYELIHLYTGMDSVLRDSQGNILEPIFPDQKTIEDYIFPEPTPVVLSNDDIERLK